MWAFHEFIAFPCRDRYSMPLGLLGGPPWLYRVYRGTGLYDREYDCLLLLAPTDPILFLESMNHSLEKRLDYSSGQLLIDPSLGSWFSCTPALIGGGPDYKLYYCHDLRSQNVVEFTGYIRAYGCFVELLIMHSRIIAGVAEPDARILEYLASCVERSARSGGIREVTRRLVQSLLDSMQPSSTSENRVYKDC